MNKISISEYQYNLPDEFIAKYPCERREESKLLVYNEGIISQNTFFNISDFIKSDGLIVVNNTRVIHSRLNFKKETGAIIEVFCLEPYEMSYEEALNAHNKCKWKCLIGNKKKWKEGNLTLNIKDPWRSIDFTAIRIDELDDCDLICFEWNDNEITFAEIIEKIGHIPIPPYLNRKDEEIDRSRYQTIYSSEKGSVAAPTAGLHLTPVVIERLEAKNVSMANITLHVGAGTFKPVKVDDALNHIMHTEHIIINKSELEKIYSNLGNITAVGTTSLRTLESIYQIGLKILKNESDFLNITQWEAYTNSQISAKESILSIIDYMTINKLKSLSATTQIMIVPGYEFKVVNRLITNFHQPSSTLLLLIAAFIGDDWKKVYNYALEHNLRFLSYGDSSLLIKG